MLLLSCAGVAPALRPAPTGVEKYGDAVDWARAGDEAAALLSEYLKVDTFNPPGNETRGAQWFASVLQREGVEHQVGEGERANLIARLRATQPSGEQPLCLLSHTDVVTAEAERWARPPLSGDIVDGYVWGRGALDMKGMGVVELMTLLTLKRQGVPLKRDVVLLAVSDEEVGNTGMQRAVQDGWPDCGHVVNEGGLGLRDVLVPGQTAFTISVAEKGVLWLRLRARGEAGHGSTPAPGRAPMELLQAASALMSRDPKPRIHPAMYELLRRAGEHRGGFNGFVMQRPALVDAFVAGRLMKKPTTRATVTDTCQVTGYSGIGSSTNVIPSEVYANVDCRVLPGTEPEALLAELNGLIAGIPGVSLEVVEKSAASESTWDDDLFAALARHAVRGRDDAIAGPVLSPGYTDSMHARKKGARAYGFIPFEISQEELGQMHGRDERVSVANLQRGLEVLFRAVVDVTTLSSASAAPRSSP